MNEYPAFMSAYGFWSSFLNDSVSLMLVRKTDAFSLLCTDALVESKDSTQQCCQGDYLKIQGFFIAVLAQRWEMRQ